jgi:pyruvate dehydrogenase E1 component alpha subunit
VDPLAGRGLQFIEARTYRLRGHYMGDVACPRLSPKEEYDERAKQEPVGRYRRWLLENGRLTEAELQEIEAGIEAELQEAIEFVNQSPVPDISEVEEHVYA